ncbi:MAG: hypothetical protein Q8P61_01485 [Candidatus Nanopelagicales bacterium]|nr:hypothetical protein [Candidatus Nanopelagicales bacterium]
MSAAIVFSAVVAIYVLVGLLGRKLPAGENSGFSRTFALTLPIVTVASAATLAIGFNIWSAVIAAISVLVAVVAAGLVSRGGWVRFETRSPAASFAGWLCSVVVVVGFGLVLVDFAVGVAADLTGLAYWALAIPVIVGGVAAGWGGGGGRGRAKFMLVVVAVIAVLALVGGIFLGSPANLGTRMIPAGDPGWLENIAFPVALVIAALAHPGLGLGRGSKTRPTIITAITSALVLLATMAGLLMLLGGVIVAPSVQLNALVAFLPPAINIGLGAIAVALAVTVLAQSTDLILNGLSELDSLWPSSAGGQVCRRASLAAVLGLVWLVLALWSPSPVTVVGALAVVSIVGLFLRLRASRAAPSPAAGDAPRESERTNVG